MLTTLLCFVSMTVALAEEPAKPANKMDNASEEALTKTQQMLTDPKKRKEAMGNDAKAKDADDRVKAVAGSDENAEAIYSLSADIMANITREAKGDPQKMQKLLQEAMKDPAAFAEKFTPEQKAKLKEIVDKTPDTSKKP